MLAQSEVASFLIQRQLISAATIVDGDFQVVEASRRNRNFKVICEAGPSYLLKQGLGENGQATIGHESTVYQRLEKSPADSALRAHLPRYCCYDGDDGVLVLELLKNAQDFREYHSHRGHFSVRMAAALGRALSDLHRATDQDVKGERDDEWMGRLPWVLSLNRPSLRLFRDISLANVQLIRIIQNTPGFPEMLNELRRGWRIDSLIHHDIKWDNCLIFPLPGSKRKFGLKLVDWEFAGLGDSCWDAGAILSNYLSFWLFSIPVSGEEPPDHLLALAQYPLDRMQPAIRAYWQAYVRGMGFESRRGGRAPAAGSSICGGTPGADWIRTHATCQRTCREFDLPAATESQCDAKTARSNCPSAGYSAAGRG